MLCPIKAAREKVEDEQGSRLANEDREDGLQEHNFQTEKEEDEQDSGLANEDIEDGLQDHNSTQEASIFTVVDSRTHGCRFFFRLCSP